MSVSSARLVLHFDVHEPVELTELTLSFGSLAKQYRKFLADKAKGSGNKISDADIKLYTGKGLSETALITALSPVLPCDFGSSTLVW